MSLACCSLSICAEALQQNFKWHSNSQEIASLPQCPSNAKPISWQKPQKIQQNAAAVASPLFALDCTCISVALSNPQLQTNHEPLCTDHLLYHLVTRTEISPSFQHLAGSHWTILLALSLNSSNHVAGSDCWRDRHLLFFYGISCQWYLMTWNH